MAPHKTIPADLKKPRAHLVPEHKNTTNIRYPNHIGQGGPQEAAPSDAGGPVRPPGDDEPQYSNGRLTAQARRMPSNVAQSFPNTQEAQVQKAFKRRLSQTDLQQDANQTPKRSATNGPHYGFLQNTPSPTRHGLTPLLSPFQGRSRPKQVSAQPPFMRHGPQEDYEADSPPRVGLAASDTHIVRPSTQSGSFATHQTIAQSAPSRSSNCYPLSSRPETHAPLDSAMSTAKLQYTLMSREPLLQTSNDAHHANIIDVESIEHQYVRQFLQELQIPLPAAYKAAIHELVIWCADCDTARAKAIYDEARRITAELGPPTAPDPHFKQATRIFCKALMCLRLAKFDVSKARVGMRLEDQYILNTYHNCERLFFAREHGIDSEAADAETAQERSELLQYWTFLKRGAHDGNQGDINAGRAV
ncbi:hypothetical protein PMZ80_005953 [Knufia obscura]|uniref:Uncharacterized protein n=1 Tax=Knufia obscura TaxID=1635080 RepID=A0ABR0RN11_9EURO|nr:hypothetical protein PMZ80_005953 [Knufia obscura]